MKLQKPLHSPLILKRLHPLVQDLTACYIFNEYGCLVICDLTNNHNNALLTGINMFTSSGVKATVSGQAAVLDNTDSKLLNVTAGTIVMYFKSFSSFSDNQFRMLFGIYGAGYSAGDFIIYKYSNNRLYFFIQDSTYHYVRYDNTQFPNWEKGQQISILWDLNNIIFSGSNMAVNVDGNYITPDFTNNPAGWAGPFAPNLAILNDYDNLTRVGNGMVGYMNIYNKALPQSALKELAENPYNIFLTNEEIYFMLLQNFNPGSIFDQQKFFGANAFPIGLGV